MLDCENLRKVSISFKSSIIFNFPIGKFPLLEDLTINTIQILFDHSKVFSNIRILHLHMNENNHLDFLPDMFPNLEKLTLSTSTCLDEFPNDISYINNFKYLTSIYLCGMFENFSLLKNVTEVSELHLTGCRRLKSLTGLNINGKWSKIVISGNKSLENIDIIEKLKYLDKASFSTRDYNELELELFLIEYPKWQLKSGNTLVYYNHEKGKLTSEESLNDRESLLKRREEILKKKEELLNDKETELKRRKEILNKQEKLLRETS
jgi:hypothetical protein